LRRRVLAAISLLLCAAAHAGLGGSLDSVYSDQQASGAGSAIKTNLAGATQYTLQQANGVTVRQYVGTNGMVFGVAWSGPVLPDFKRLLGAHFAAYDQAQHQNTRHISIQSDELVVEAGGMMRSFSGHALLPGQMPPTLSRLDIR
jgi:hypothetical protein